MKCDPAGNHVQAPGRREILHGARKLLIRPPVSFTIGKWYESCALKDAPCCGREGGAAVARDMDLCSDPMSGELCRVGRPVLLIGPPREEARACNLQRGGLQSM